MSDGRQLAVLPMSREPRTHVGRTVALQRDTTDKPRTEALTIEEERNAHDVLSVRRLALHATAYPRVGVQSQVLTLRAREHRATNANDRPNHLA